MSAFDWAAAAEQDPARLTEARTQLVSAAQWLARIERSYVPREAGKPFSLRWRDDRKALTTHGFADEIVLELQIDRLVMQFTERGAPSDHAIDVDEHSPAHVEAWILIELLHRGVDRDRFSKELPYDTSGLFSGDGVEFSPTEYAPELAALAALFRGAVETIREASDDASGVRIFPADLNVEGSLGDTVIGFSLGDETVSDPHFYASRDSGLGPDHAGPMSVLKLSDVPAGEASGAIASFLKAGGAPTRH